MTESLVSLGKRIVSLLPAFGWTCATMAILAVVILLAGYGK